MTGSQPDTRDEATRPISVAELLAKNGTIGSPPVTGRRRRRRNNSSAVTVAELTGEIPVITADDTDDAGAVADDTAAENRTADRPESARATETSRPSVEPPSGGPTTGAQRTSSTSDAAAEAEQRPVTKPQPVERLVQPQRTERTERFDWNEPGGRWPKSPVQSRSGDGPARAYDPRPARRTPIADRAVESRARPISPDPAVAPVDEYPVDTGGVARVEHTGPAGSAAGPDDGVTPDGGALLDSVTAAPGFSVTADAYPSGDDYRADDYRTDEYSDRDGHADDEDRSGFDRSDEDERDYADEDYDGVYTGEDYTGDDYAEDDYAEDDYAEDDYAEDDYAEDDYAEDDEADDYASDDYASDEYADEEPRRRSLLGRARGMFSRRRGDETDETDEDLEGDFEADDSDDAGAVDVTESTGGSTGPGIRFTDGAEDTVDARPEAGVDDAAGGTETHEAAEATEATEAAEAERAGEADGEDDDDAGDIDLVAVSPRGRRSELLGYTAIVLESLLAVTFGGGIFYLFGLLWRWNNIIALMLTIVVTILLAVAVRVVRRTEDITSTLLAVALGLFITLAPLVMHA